MSHPSLFASPMLPIVNPEILGIARFFFIFLFMFTHIPHKCQPWENNYWLISINYAN